MSVSVETRPECRVSRLADRVVLPGDGGPVVDGVLQTVVGCESADHDQGLAGALGNRGNAGQASQSLIISTSQRVVCFCEQRGEDDPADAWKRFQDFRVTLRLRSRQALPEIDGRRQCLGQPVHFAIRLGQLLSECGELGEDDLEMSSRGLRGARSDGDCGFAEPLQHRFGIDAPDTVAFEEVGDAPDPDAPCLLGSWCELPELVDPGSGEIAFDLEELRITAPELLTGAVHEPGSVAGEVVGNSRPFPELDDFRRGRIQAPEGVTIGPQSVGQHLRVATVVPGAGRREAVAEAIRLPGIDRVHQEAAIHHGFHNRPMRALDRDSDPLRFRARHVENPVRHFRKTGTAMTESPLAQDLACAIDNADLVSFRTPVDPCNWRAATMAIALEPRLTSSAGLRTAYPCFWTKPKRSSLTQ